MSFFRVSNLTAGYGGKKILENVSFEMNQGQLVGILGANGSGKTTLLKTICNILPHSGVCKIVPPEPTIKKFPEETISLEKLSAKKMAEICSYIPQRSGISIDISALDVVLMGFNPRLGLFEHPNRSMRETALRILQDVGLSGREDMNYLHLSEGQKQLCILARTLAADARLLLLDEPESALDFRYRYRMLEILKKWLTKGERGAIVALHDPSLALNFCDELLLFSEGKIYDKLDPSSDSLEEMEQKLALIYGPVSLQKCRDKSGRTQLVMLKEPEEL